MVVCQAAGFNATKLGAGGGEVGPQSNDVVLAPVPGAEGCRPARQVNKVNSK